MMTFLAGFLAGSATVSVIGAVITILITRTYQEDVFLPLEDEENA